MSSSPKTPELRGYFGIGVEGISKPMNAGAIFRTAHAFGANFVFTAGAVYAQRKGALSDTSNAPGHMPFYSFPDTASLILPDDCRLVGVELTDESIELPSFRHPSRAAYVLGAERGSLSDEMTDRCEFVVKIPMRFCVNVSVAAAIVMYDRMASLGKFAPRPVRPGAPTETIPEHIRGGPTIRSMRKFQTDPPLGGDFDANSDLAVDTDADEAL